MKRQEIFTETIKDQIYQILKQEIVNCTLKSGDKLVEQTIADRLNVSRSPVREAIKQLTGDGLVENIPNKGAFVRKPTNKELVDMYEVRLMFEVYAVRHAALNMKKADEQQLKKLRENIVKAYESKNAKAYLEADRELSAAIIRLSGNMVIISTYGNLYTMMNNFSNAALSQEERFDASVNERTAVIDAILDHNEEKAVELITLHLTRAKEIIQAIMEHR